MANDIEPGHLSQGGSAARGLAGRGALICGIICIFLPFSFQRINALLALARTHLQRRFLVLLLQQRRAGACAQQARASPPRTRLRSGDKLRVASAGAGACCAYQDGAAAAGTFYRTFREHADMVRASSRQSSRRGRRKLLAGDERPFMLSMARKTCGGSRAYLQNLLDFLNKFFSTQACLDVDSRRYKRAASTLPRHAKRSQTYGKNSREIISSSLRRIS